MKLNFDEIKNILKQIDKEYGYFYIPLESDEVENLCSFNGTFIHYTFTDDLLDLEYSENGLTFNLYSDWYVEVDNKGNFKGKGSTRHKETIKDAIEWFIKIVYDNSLHTLLDYYPS